jgi:hypothetical protein
MVLPVVDLVPAIPVLVLNPAAFPPVIVAGVGVVVVVILTLVLMLIRALILLREGWYAGEGQGQNGEGYGCSDSFHRDFDSSGLRTLYPLQFPGRILAVDGRNSCDRQLNFLTQR